MTTAPETASALPAPRLAVHAMLLAAGLGTRLRPVTDSMPKPAVPFFGRPILLRTLDLLGELGVLGAVANSHYRAADLERVLAGSPIPVSLSHEPAILGTGGALRQARPLLGDGTVLLVNGDIAFDLPLGEALVAHVASGAAVTLVLLPNPDPRRYGRIVAPRPFHAGVPSDPLRRVESILPPGAGEAGHLYTGIAFLACSALERLPGGASELVPALLRPLAAEGALAGWVAPEGLWYDLGTPAELLGSHLDLLRRMLSGRPEARAFARRLVGAPLVFDRERRSAIHPEARVDGLVDEIVADRGCVVGADAEIRRSLLLPGARVGAGIDPGNRVVLPG